MGWKVYRMYVDWEDRESPTPDAGKTPQVPRGFFSLILEL